MKYRVRHVTQVRYESAVNLARFNLRLRPADWPGQSLTDFSLQICPEPRTIVSDRGPFIVNIDRITLDEPTASLKVTSEFSVKVERPPPPLAELSPGLPELRRQALADRGLSARDPATYLFASPVAAMAPEIAYWAGQQIPAEPTTIEAASAVMHAIHAQFSYDSGATRADTPPLEAFQARHGVCQDFAHIMIIALRHFGVPAAYVSGYLRTIPPPGKDPLTGADATHAWVNVWCGEQLGWIGFDPTNAILVENDHIFTAMGRDFGDVSPLDGVFIGGAGQRMNVSVDVTPLED